MRIALPLAAAAAALSVSACGLGAPAYPNFADATAYRVEGNTASPDGSAATHTVIYRDGPKMRVEAMLPHYGNAIVVFDQSTNAAYVLNPTAQPVPSATLPAPGTATATPVPGTTATTTTTPSATTATTTTAPVTTAATPQVVGVAVRLADADAPQPMETAWAALGKDNARSVGNCEVAGERGHEWEPKTAPAPGVERRACISNDGIVLRVTESGRTLWEATSLQRGQQDAALFGVPPGYQLIDPDAVAEGVGSRMEQLDSVTGTPTTPPATTTPAPRG